MTAAVAGIAGYFVLGILGFLVPWARALSAGALLVGTVAYALWFPGFPTGYLGLGDWAIPWRGDILAASFWGLSLFLHLILLVHQEGGRPQHYYALVTLLFGTVLSTVLSQDIFNLYVSLELTSLIAFLLVGIEGKPAQVWASLKYLILTSCGMIFYLLGVGFVYAETETLSLVQLSSSAPAMAPGLRLGIALLLTGAAAKGGVFFYALWLPVAHGYAPAPVSALLSSLVVKMGIVALARISAAFGIGEVLVALGLVTGFLGILHMFWEKKLKVFLAYSTMSQLGYVLLGFGLGAWEGAVAYAVAHGLFKALLFLAAGEAEREAKSHLIPRHVGRISGETRALLGLGALAIMGVPPLAGYAAKGLITAVAPPWVKGVLIALSLGTAASFARLLVLPLGEGPKFEIRHPALWVLVAAVAGTGIWGLVSFPGIALPRALLTALLASAAGITMGWPFSRLSARLPRWHLEEALLALLFASLALLLFQFLSG